MTAADEGDAVTAADEADTAKAADEVAEAAEEVEAAPVAKTARTFNFTQIAVALVIAGLLASPVFSAGWCFSAAPVERGARRSPAGSGQLRTGAHQHRLRQGRRQLQAGTRRRNRRVQGHVLPVERRTASTSWRTKRPRTAW